MLTDLAKKHFWGFNIPKGYKFQGIKSAKSRRDLTSRLMKIWIDGDACPKAIKQILFRAAVKRQVNVTIVANHIATIPSSPFIKRVQVEFGFDKADKFIVTHIEPKDLVITADIILANEVIIKEALALNPRGMLYTTNNIKQILTMRHFNESLRESGLIQGGLDALSAKEIQSFSNHLDRIITLSGC